MLYTFKPVQMQVSATFLQRMCLYNTELKLGRYTNKEESDDIHFWRGLGPLNTSP